VNPHAPPAQARTAFGTAGHALVHVPQWSTDDPSATSQPLAALPSQSAKPALQAPTLHVPLRQAGLALAGAEHTVPQAPQARTEDARSASQPFAGSPSQSANPVRHAPSPHTPEPQDAEALAGGGQLVAHAPQWSGALPRLVSQPLAGVASQSP
jgi:hypothetical protein